MIINGDRYDDINRGENDAVRVKLQLGEPFDMHDRSYLLAAGVGIIGAAINRTLARAGNDIGAGVPGTPDTYRWRGVDVAYTTRGDPNDPDVVCLHDPGIIGTSNEFRDLAEQLADEYHVIAPDLPGYGRSDRPPLRYSSSLYQSFIRAFITDVATNPVVIASGITGSYVADAAAEVPLREAILIGPLDTTREHSAERHAVLRAPGIGTAIYNAVSTRSAIRRRERTHSVYASEGVDADRIEYLWQSAHQSGARFAPAARMSGALDPGSTLETVLERAQAPITLLWGREATTPPVRRGRTLAETADVQLTVIEYAAGRPHIEHPETVRDVIASHRLQAASGD